MTAPTEQAICDPVEVTVVMPCLDEARTVGRCIDKAMKAFAEMGVVGEVVVADNMSSDRSPDIARSHGARVVPVQRRGYGSALQGGIAAARGRFVIIGDADDSYDFTALAPFVERLRDGDELVVGNRFRGGIRPGAMPWLHRYVGNPVLSGILNLFFRTPIGDAHCGLRGFRKEAYERLGLSAPGMEFASEMVVKAALLGLKMSEVPTVLHPDGRDRPPHLRSFRDGWRHLRFLLLMSPGWLFLLPALVLLLLGGLALVLGLALAPPRDVSVLLLAGLGLVSGHQACWLWSFTHAPGQRGPGRFSLEVGLLGGTAAALAGAAVWGSSLLGPEAAAARFAVGGAISILLGVQAVFNSFFLAALRLNAGPDRPARG